MSVKKAKQHIVEARKCMRMQPYMWGKLAEEEFEAALAELEAVEEIRSKPLFGTQHIGWWYSERKEFVRVKTWPGYAIPVYAIEELKNNEAGSGPQPMQGPRWPGDDGMSSHDPHKSQGEPRCDTCEGTGEVRIEPASFDTLTGGSIPCPDCRGKPEPAFKLSPEEWTQIKKHMLDTKKEEACGIIDCLTTDTQQFAAYIEKLKLSISTLESQLKNQIRWKNEAWVKINCQAKQLDKMERVIEIPNLLKGGCLAVGQELIRRKERLAHKDKEIERLKKQLSDLQTADKRPSVLHRETE